jgi:hypothetical protein
MLTLKRLSEGVWFDYPQVEGVRLKVRPVTLAKGQEIRNSLRTKKYMEFPDPKRKGKKFSQVVDDVDDGAVLRAIWDYALEAFEGIGVEDATGAILSDPKQIRDAIYESDDLRDFISERSAELRESGEQKLEDELKNSDSSQSG